MFQYKTFYRSLIEGEGYDSTDETLNEYGEDGWELVQVIMQEKLLVNERLEIFYFMKRGS